MPDISMCKNEDCPLKESCYRYMATPNIPYQSYGKFDHKKIMGIVVCDHQIEIDNDTPTI